MAVITTAVLIILLILVVLTVFNIIIFVHELGHFWAAKWRGLQIDRFQIWFGKPIWKKTINGVQYGLGWIPAGGFVALPQMAPMEAIEGGEKQRDPLPPISPLDKIIVAFAGPLFSILLALLSAVVVWQVGKPKDFVPSQEIGYVVPGDPADLAGLKPGDKIIAINGKEVNGFAGTLNSISESIVLSSGDKITFTIEREGEDQPIDLVSEFKEPESKWYQRGGLRQVGIDSAGPAIVGSVIPNSPADKAGLTSGDRITVVDGQKLYGILQLTDIIKRKNWQAVTMNVVSPDGSEREVTITPAKPTQPADADPMIGIYWDTSSEVDVRLVKPNPFEQVKDSLVMMWVTITSVVDKDTSIGVGHLSGPVGIGSMMYDLLQTENGWRRIIAFMVLFNVNLAVLNMLPFPVLDGGHITLAILEKIAGRPVQAKALEVIQTVCALALISLMLYVTSKDIGDRVGGGGASKEVIFAE